MARLKEQYRDRIVKEMMEEHGYSSVMEVPRIEKITINMGLGEAVGDKKVLENAVSDMTAIGGQKPVVTVARKSIAGFKIRDGYPIGAKVTLRSRAHVRVPRPTRGDRNPAHPGLPGHQPAQLRRARQLQSRA